MMFAGDGRFKEDVHAKNIDRNRSDNVDCERKPGLHYVHA
jgi:hypothetical protein